jgi:putative aldouronate transport system substrate-binding protein
MVTNKNQQVRAAICALLAIVMVAGCSSGGGQSQAPVASKPADNVAKKEEAMPQGGKLSDKPVTVKFMLREHAAQPILMDTPVLQEIFNKTNVKIEIQSVPASNYEEKSRTLIATNNIPDVLWMSTSKEIFEFANTGLFLPISDYFQNAPNFSKLVKATPEFDKLKVNGKLYGFPVMGKWRIRNGQVPMIRMDVLEKLNLQAPKSFDELYEVLKKMKAAYPNTYPITYRSGIKNFLPYMAFNLGSGYTIYYEPEQKKYIYGPATPDFKPVLAYFNKLYSEKLLDPDYAVNTPQTWQEKLSSGKSLFYLDNNTFAVNFTKALQAKEPGARFEQIQLLKNDKGQARGIEYPPHWWNVFAINSKAKNPEIIVKLMDWLYSEEGSTITNFGVLNKHYTVENGVPKVLDSVMQEYKDKQDPFRAMQSALGTGLLSFATYVDERPQVAVSPPELVKWSELFSKDPGHYVKPLDPPFDKKETDQLKKLSTQVDTLVEQEMDNFIMGVKPLSQYDDFAKQLREKGATEIENIYNAALARLK